MSNSIGGNHTSGGKVRIWVDGCFDITHYGHFNALRQAKEMGDELVVGVHSDEEIARNKGPTVFTEEERYAVVRACKWVNEVVEDAPYFTSVKVMDQHHCQFCVHGDDITTTADGTDCYAEVKQLNRYQECKRTDGISTTELVGRMLLMTREHHQRDLNSSDSLSQFYDMSIFHDPISDVKDLAVNGNTTSDVQSQQNQQQQQQQQKDGQQSLKRTLSLSQVAGVQKRTKELQLFMSPGDDNQTSMPTTVSFYLRNPDRLAYIDGSQSASATVRSSVLQTSSPTLRNVAFIVGDFDLFHLGHIKFLSLVKSMYDFVIIGMLDDSSVNQLKGSSHPIMNMHERTLSVLACRYVDHVVIKCPMVIDSSVHQILTDHIKFIVHGGNKDASKDSNYNEPSVKIDFMQNLGNFDEHQDGADIFGHLKAVGVFRQLPSNHQEVDSTSNAMHTKDVVDRIVRNRLMYEDRMKRKAEKAKREDEMLKMRSQSQQKSQFPQQSGEQ
ncbi:hypothetical protein MP228_008333 [Amoeboaphelidium protococcarum]|nr:hypothetical protein MP228_008333 [Amoeboaphelidium protococcarum]